MVYSQTQFRVILVRKWQRSWHEGKKRKTRLTSAWEKSEITRSFVPVFLGEVPSGYFGTTCIFLPGMVTDGSKRSGQGICWQGNIPASFCSSVPFLGNYHNPVRCPAVRHGFQNIPGYGKGGTLIARFPAVSWHHERDPGISQTFFHPDPWMFLDSTRSKRNYPKGDSIPIQWKNLWKFLSKKYAYPPQTFNSLV